MKLSLDKIRTDGDTQPRERLDASTVDDYAEVYREGTRFPPVVVFHDGTSYFLADGFHREAAARLADLPEIETDVRQGTRRDAILYACGANTDNGLRRTKADKARVIERLLRDEEWSRWSDRQIGVHCSVSDDMVSKGRLRLSSG